VTLGTRIGPYELIAFIAAGGMGEVYRARDSKLKRDVALKVLPDAFARDPGRMARFQREAEVLASLNHPNIAHIYGVEERALVMELVEGESPKGPLPFEEAWKIALQIADALEYAHERGVIHRDLKPANVKVTPDGVVKLLDFGLAKAFSQTPESASADPENSPTVTLGATVAGTVMGTAAYMAPEQAKGKRVDKRADIWSWGVVLFELLTGERLFKGEDVADTLAQVLTKAPGFERAPAKARRLLRECLERDPNLRLRDIGDARRLLLEDESAGSGPSTSRRAYVGWVAAGVFALVAAGLGTVYWSTARPVERPLTRFNVDLGPGSVQGPRTTAVLSPDGTRIVFPLRGSNGAVQLATRALDQPKAAAISGTEGGSDPFFSPDGQWVGFFAGGKLKKVAVQGGGPVTLCDVAAARGGSWGEDGNIIFTPNISSGLMRISSAGGTPEPLTKLGVNESSHRWPQVLPGGRAVLFTANTNPFDWEDGYISTVSINTREVKVVQRGGYFGRYLPSANGGGHLLYLHESTLFAVPFEPSRLETSGTPARLVEDVAGNFLDAGGQFDSSWNGSLVYLNSEATGRSSYPIVWMDSVGKFTPLVVKPGAYGAPRFSPDGKRIAFTARGAKGFDLWVYDLERDIPAQLTFNGPGDLEMAWTPDGKHIVF
jgi:serine/threonine-protein kinase